MSKVESDDEWLTHVGQ